VRLSKIQVVVLALSCLLCAGSAQAQFGKLKDLAKDKMGLGSKEEQKPSAEPAGKNKGSFGEAKATYAAGVKKSVAVKRQSGRTPEANIASNADANIAPVSTGSSQQVTIKISHLDARQFDSVRAYGPCNKISNFQVLSATQMKVTIDLTANKSAGSCPLYFRTGDETVFSSVVTIQAKK